MAKVPGINDFAAAAAAPIQQIIAASPGFLATSRSSGDLRDNIKGALELGKDNIEAAGRELGVQTALGVLDNINPALGDIARKALGRGRTDVANFPVDKPENPSGWYALGRKRLDPMWSYLWDIDLPDLPGMKALPREYVEEISVALPSSQDFNIFRNGTYSYYATFADVGTLSLNVYEDQRLSASQYFQRWRNLIQNVDGTFNAPNDYKRTIMVYLLDNDNSKIAYFKITGCFPTTREGHVMNSGASDRHILNITFSITSIDFVVLNASPIVFNTQNPTNPSAASSSGLLGKVLSVFTQDNTQGIAGFISNTATTALDKMKSAAGIVKAHIPSKI